MKSSERPPLKHKRGIHVVQPAHLQPKRNEEGRQMQSGSVQSVSRNRGISISRESGITMDKIYDAKHFLPVKSPSQQTNKTQSTQFKTLTSVKSLKLISVFAESNAQNTSQAFKNASRQQEEIPIRQFEIKHEHLNSIGNRCNSPILKLGNAEDEKQTIKGKGEQVFLPNLLKF